MSISLRAALAAGALILSQRGDAAPVSLNEALSRGVELSPRIAQAKAELDAADGRARQAGVLPNPELALEAENFAGTGPYRDTRQTETTLALSQRLELGGKRSARVAVARAERDFAALAYLRAGADLARDIRFAHAELQAASERAIVARDNAARAADLARTAGLLVEAGRDPPLRRLRAEALLAEARAEDARSAAAFVAAQRKLASLTGSDDPDLTAGAADEPKPQLLPPATPSLDERLSEAERAAARARIRVAEAAAIPDLTASGGVRRFSDGRETAAVAGLSLPLGVFDRNRGGIAAARSDAIAAEARLAQTRLDALRARRDAAAALAGADARLAALAGSGVVQAEEALRLARVGYGAGKFSLIELIDAQSAFNTARLALIEARADRARALADLARANTQ